jgi:hypothetical protein
MNQHLPAHGTFYLTVTIVFGIALASPLTVPDVLGNFYGGNIYAANNTFHAIIECLTATLLTNASSSRMLFATAAVRVLLNNIHTILHWYDHVSVAGALSMIHNNSAPIYKDMIAFYGSFLIHYSDQDFLLSSEISGFIDDLLRLVAKKRRSHALASFDMLWISSSTPPPNMQKPSILRDLSLGCCCSMVNGRSSG